MKNIIYVPVWLREYLSSRSLGYDVLFDGSLTDILSAADVNSYEMANEIPRLVPEQINPLFHIGMFFRDFTVAVGGTSISYFCSPEEWLKQIAGSQALDSQEFSKYFLFYYGLGEGPSITGIARKESNTSIVNKSRKLDFDFEIVGDNMVVIASYNDSIDNSSYGYRAELMSKCIEKMHLFMSFEEIAGTEIFSAFTRYVGLENQFVRNDAALPDRS